MSFEQWLQSRLTAHGFPCGKIDGIIGPITTAALKAFQKKRGIPVTGTATAATVEALRATSNISEPFVRPTVDNRWPTQSGVPSFYGPVGVNQTRLQLPYPMKLSWDKSIKINSISVHEKVAASASRAFESIVKAYPTEKERADLGIDLFGGSLNVRKMRGGSSYSMHSWGIAIDFDPERNQLSWGREKARLAKEDAIPFWEAWEAEGWVSLGRTKNYDWMHCQAARL